MQVIIQPIASKVFFLLDRFRGKIPALDFVDTSGLILILLYIFSDKKAVDLDRHTNPLSDSPQIPEILGKDWRDIMEIYRSCTARLDSANYDFVVDEVYEFVQSNDFASIRVNFKAIAVELLQSTRLFRNTSFEPNLKDLMSLALTFSGYTKGKSLYNPFCGSGSLALHLDVDAKDYHGVEQAAHSWLFEKLCSLADGRELSEFRMDDSAKDIISRNESFDNVICIPPLGLSLPGVALHFANSKYDSNKRYQIAPVIASEGFRILSEEGTMCLILPSSLTFNATELGIPAEHFKMVVSLPDGLIPDTKIAVSLFVITKQKNDGTVLLVDATSMKKKSERIGNCLDTDTLMDIISKRNSDYCLSASVEDIVSNDMCFLRGRYLEDAAIKEAVPQGHRIVALSDILTAYNGLPASGDRFREIRIKDLSTSPANAAFLFDSIEPVESEGKTRKVLHDDCLLVASVGTNLKPTYYKHIAGDADLTCHSHVKAFRINTSVVLPEYLIAEFYKDYVKKQLSTRFAGISIPRISPQDLLTVRIGVPPIQEQAALAKEFVLNYQKEIISNLGINEAAIRKNSEERFLRNTRLRKHALAQVLNEFGPAFDLLHQRMIRNGGFLKIDDIVATRTGETVGQYFDKLKTYLSKVESMVANFTNDNSYGTSEAIELPLFLEEYIATRPKSSQYDIILENRENETTELAESARIQFGKADLIQILENIIANAVKYGFSRPDDQKYRLKFVIEPHEDPEKIVLQVMNDGDALPKGMTPEKVFIWGEGNGTGMGGWQIRDIAEHFGATVTLENNPDSIWKIVYTFVLPLA